MATKLIPILCIDSRWTARHKWLFDTIPDDYSNYLDVWDGVPWQLVMHGDSVERDYNMAAPAQYLPKYATEPVGDVADLLAILAADDIAEAEIFAQYAHGAPVKRVTLTDLLYRDFNRASAGCPIVFSRPMTFTLGGPGHLGDNSSTSFFIHAEDSCDGTVGMQPPEGGGHYAPEFRADAIHFTRTVPAEEMTELIGEADLAEAKLCACIIAATSVPRIMINGSWINTGTIPPDPPYHFALRGIKCVLGTASELLDLSPGAENTFIVENICAYTDSIGAQAIFYLQIETDDDIFEPVTEGNTMADTRSIPKNPAEHLQLLQLCNARDDDPATIADYKFLQKEKDALVAALNLVQATYNQWKTRSDEWGELTAAWTMLAKEAKDLIGRVRSFWRMRFEEGNVYERNANIDTTPTKKKQLSMALYNICIISDDNAATDAESKEDNGSVSVSIDRAGYYNVEFDSRDLNTRVDYPEGDLEVWLIPESGDLRIFRSEAPRVIIEKDTNGALEILVLLDRTQTSVLVDVESVNGTIQSQVYRPDEAALYVRYEDAETMKITRAIVVGNRRTDLLWKLGSSSGGNEWKLGYNSLFGLNPGVEFEWPFHIPSDISEGPILWSFFPENAFSMTPYRLYWQRQIHQAVRHEEQADAVTLSRWLPLLDPFPVRSAVTETLSSSGVVHKNDPDDFISLFPELTRGFVPVSNAGVFHSVDLNSGTPETAPVIAGTFPDSAGRWRLALFGQTAGQDLRMQSWLVSTELPVRSRIEGPRHMRVGDTVEFSLSIENTTRRRVDLQSQIEAAPGLSFIPLNSSNIRLQPNEERIISIPFQADFPGVGTIDLRLDSIGSVSEALHTTEVMADQPDRGFTFIVAKPQQQDLHENLIVEGWTDGELVVASSLGPLLEEIWPLIRAAQEDREPLLTALGDWALIQVDMRHGGKVESVRPDPSLRLGSLLEAYQTPSGGWAWKPGLGPDPWISALVLWTIEIFAGKDDELFAEYRQQGRRFLESILVEANLGAEIRLFALRALAGPAFHLRDVRPSRIQARTFLELLHRRDELAPVEVAMLRQVARAYGFKEEVGLLEDRLLAQFRQPSPSANVNFWPASLVNLSLDDDEVTTDEDNDLFFAALDSLSRAGPRRSWEQVAGFLNLVAAYYWKGDFYTEGIVDLSIGDSETISLALGPELPDSGFRRFPLEAELLEKGKVDIRLNTISSLSPVLFTAIGTTGESSTIDWTDSTSISTIREYFEATLMDGLRRQEKPLTDDSQVLVVGDRLRVFVDVEIPEDEPFGAFQFPVPSGFFIEPNAIQYRWEGVDGGDIQRPEIWVDVSQNESSLSSVVRVSPMPAGFHRFELLYELNWAGTYQWPEMQLILPRNGKVFRLNEASRITIGSTLD